jgi:hypothetical protein
MSVKTNSKSYFSIAAGLILIALSLVGIWKDMHHGYSRLSLLFTILVPYSIAAILGIMRLLEIKWSRSPVIALCIAGLILNVRETAELPNKKDIAEIMIFFLVLVLTIIDYSKDRGTNYRGSHTLKR